MPGPSWKIPQPFPVIITGANAGYTAIKAHVGNFQTVKCDLLARLQYESNTVSEWLYCIAHFHFTVLKK